MAINNPHPRAQAVYADHKSLSNVVYLLHKHILSVQMYVICEGHLSIHYMMVFNLDQVNSEGLPRHFLETMLLMASAAASFPGSDEWHQ